MRAFAALLTVTLFCRPAAEAQRSAPPRPLQSQEVARALPVAVAGRTQPQQQPQQQQQQQNGAVAVLRAGDMFTLRLGGMPPEFANEFALDYTVGSDGTVNIPMVGDMRATGMTSTQFQQAVQNRLIAEKIFSRPTVVIGIQQTTRSVSVGGGVRQPGRQQWSSDLTLNSAVQGAGGLTDFGSPKGVRLIREGQVSIFNLKDFDRNPAADPKLLPGDQVIVRQ